MVARATLPEAPVPRTTLLVPGERGGVTQKGRHQQQRGPPTGAVVRSPLKAAGEEDPFAMTYGALKRVLVAGAVVGAGCRDVEMKGAVQRALLAAVAASSLPPPGGLQARPLKFQMAWVIQELGLLAGSGLSVTD